jgi:putative spermidine/putrescine transport system ATP-binding protein
MNMMSHLRVSTAQHNNAIVRLVGVRKSYGGATAALEHIDLDIGRGEFFTLLGPSGSGKTTTLRLIAGFEQPTQGRIVLNGVDVVGLPPQARDVNTMFQDYALFPHMTVLQNIAYGLHAHGMAKSETATRSAEALAMVRLADFGARKPAQLSGGQRQRIALARALVNRPALLLLDEPLGALDLKLRHQMQTELKQLQRQTGITFVYVTHDQEEALTMSDRVAVFSQGRIAQIGTPRELYERPVSRFVANFVGMSNILEYRGHSLLLRPERVELHPTGSEVPSSHDAMPAEITSVAYVGAFTRCGLTLADGTAINAVVMNAGPADRLPALREGVAVIAAWHRASAYVLPE